MTVSQNKASQVGGTHYSATAAKCPHCGEEIQHWDLYADAPGLVYSATKHITRHRVKNGKQDLLKAITEIQKIIEQEYPEPEDDNDVASAISSGSLPLNGYFLTEEVMRDEWAGTRGGAAHAEASKPDPVWAGMAVAPVTINNVLFDTNPEAARARADEFARQQVDEDVPVGWSIKVVKAADDGDIYWRFRRTTGENTGWSKGYPSRTAALDALNKLAAIKSQENNAI